MIASLLHDWFGWDNGSVLTNLVASVIAFAAGLLIGRAWSRRLYEKIEAVHTHVLDLHRHHGVDTTDTR